MNRKDPTAFCRPINPDTDQDWDEQAGAPLPAVCGRSQCGKRAEFVIGWREPPIRHGTPHGHVVCYEHARRFCEKRHVPFPPVGFFENTKAGAKL